MRGHLADTVATGTLYWFCSHSQSYICENLDRDLNRVLSVLDASTRSCPRLAGTTHPPARAYVPRRSGSLASPTRHCARGPSVPRRFDARLGLARTTTPRPRTGRPKMSVAPKMLTERQQLAIALRESMTAAPARVATPGSAPRLAALSPAGDEVRAPDTSAAPPEEGCATHFQNAVARGSFLGIREHPSPPPRASDFLHARVRSSRDHRRVVDSDAPRRAASLSDAFRTPSARPARRPSRLSSPRAFPRLTAPSVDRRRLRHPRLTRRPRNARRRSLTSARAS